MKKYITLLALLFAGLSSMALAYTNTDLLYAQALADNKIIVDHAANPELYRFADTISRAELVAIALKLSGTPIPEDTICQKYFADTTQNDWVCRAVELSADKGIVSRENKNFNPQKNISKSEALAILMKIMLIKVESNASREGYSPENAQWQVDLMQSALTNGIIGSTQDFGPNRPATRADVFNFAVSVSMRLVKDTENIPTPKMAVSFGYDDDTREWVYQYSDSNKLGFIQEFTLVGDTVEDWDELVTHRVDFIPDTTLKVFVDVWKKEMKQADSKAQISSSTIKSNTIVIGYSSEMLNEKGIMKLFKGSDGIYMLLYAVRPKSYNTEYFKIWTKIVSEAKLIKNPSLTADTQ